MKKLTLLTRHFLAFLTILLIVVLNSCRKDRPPMSDEAKKSPITDNMIDEWYRSNPVSKVIPIDWGKAKQGIVDGKHFVMAPTLNVDLMKGLIADQTVLKLNKLNSTSPIPKSNGKVSVGMDPVGDNPSGDNPNYNSIHPPQVYFILDPVSSSMRTYIMNFMPDSEASGFGQGGSWTGKLYEWNTSSDTVLVQQFSNNVLTSRMVSVFPHVDENGGIAFSKPEKIQSVGPLKDKQVGGIFGWLADKILDGLGAIGYLFGLTELVPSTSGSAGHHMHYRFISSPGNSDGTSWGNSGESSFQYVTMGLPAISTYLTGISSGQSYTEVTLSSYNYNGTNAYHGGPNNMVPNAAGIELLEYINVSESAQGYILTMIANPVATVLLDFVNTQGKSPASRDFASWTVEYFASPNPKLTIKEFALIYGLVPYVQPSFEGVTVSSAPPLISGQNYAIIGKTKDRGNVEDLTHGYNHDMQGIDANIISRSLPELWASISDVIDWGTINSNAMRTVAHSFVQQFSINTSTSFIKEDATLNNIAENSPEMAGFFAGIGNKIREHLWRTGENVSTIDIDMEEERPIFGMRNNIFNGLTILLNDTEFSEIRLERYEKAGEWVHMVINVTTYDHFGVDKLDAVSKKFYHNGFQAWWVLQHRHDYVPFVTKVTTRRLVKVKL